MPDADGFDQYCPQARRSEKRAFECPKCNFIETKAVSGPLGSEQVNCLTDNIRSPHE
jgi:hypothetical protein